MPYPCSFAGCCALAETDGGTCAAHAGGYRVAQSWERLRCVSCRKLIGQGQWYRLGLDDRVTHVRPCTVHPDVAKEQSAAVTR